MKNPFLLKIKFAANERRLFHYITDVLLQFSRSAFRNQFDHNNVMSLL